jgi:hypothetical protein
MFARVDGVEADDLTGQVEPEDLFLPIVVNHVTLETPGADGRDRTEFVSGPEQVFSGLNRAGTMNDLFETLGFVRGQASREAKISQRTAAAGNLRPGRFTAVISNVGDS